MFAEEGIQKSTPIITKVVRELVPLDNKCSNVEFGIIVVAFETLYLTIMYISTGNIRRTFGVSCHLQV